MEPISIGFIIFFFLMNIVFTCLVSNQSTKKLLYREDIISIVKSEVEYIRFSRNSILNTQSERMLRAARQEAQETAHDSIKDAISDIVDKEAFIDEIIERIQRKQLK